MRNSFIAKFSFFFVFFKDQNEKITTFRNFSQSRFDFESGTTISQHNLIFGPILQPCYCMLFGLFLLTDYWQLWNGAPFYYAGRNSILIYLLHSLVGGRIPLDWEPVVSKLLRLVRETLISKKNCLVHVPQRRNVDAMHVNLYLALLFLLVPRT